jgi:hypothetical protein
MLLRQSRKQRKVLRSARKLEMLLELAHQQRLHLVRAEQSLHPLLQPPQVMPDPELELQQRLLLPENRPVTELPPPTPEELEPLPPAEDQLKSLLGTFPTSEH